MCQRVTPRAATDTAVHMSELLNAPYQVGTRHWPKLPKCPSTTPDTPAPGSPGGHERDSPETGHVSSMPEAVLHVPTSSLHLLPSPLLPEQAQLPALLGEELTLSHPSDGPQGCSVLLSSLGVTFAWQ